MIQQDDLSSITLLHQPYGEHHPYIPLATERMPRDPIAGDLITLGVETSHKPAVDLVWCIWQIEGDPTENRTEATKIVNGESADQWQVNLPAFKSDEIVRYCLFASGAGQQVHTDTFTFSVLTWVDVVAIVAVTETGRRLAVKLATDRPNLLLNMEVEPDSSGTVSIRFSTHSETGLLLSQPEGKEVWLAEVGDVRFSLFSNPVKLEFVRDSDGLRLQSIHPVRILARADGTVLQYQLGFESSTDEAFYGFGERFNAIDQRGNRLDNYVYGQYTGQGKRTYIPVPFFISSRGYGFWLKTDSQAVFDLTSTRENCWTVTGRGDDPNTVLEMKFFLQNNPKEIIQAFTNHTGKPKLPPSWVFGPWMSSNDWNTQSEVLRQMHLTQHHQIPASVLVIEAWSDEMNFYIWNDAQYRQKPSSQAYGLSDFTFSQTGHWPNPKAMVDQLHQAGLRLVLWQNPAIKHRDPRENMDDRLTLADENYAIQHEYVVQKADGSPHRVEPHMPWFGGSLVFDFSNPEAANWWFKKREYLVTEIGVDGFKTDGGEHVWDMNTRFHNGMDGNRGINTYPVIYEAAYQRFMETHHGNDYVLFSRAGYTGSQTVPCHWAGDENSTWDAFRASVRAMLNVGLSGVPFIGWDIAGFAGPLPSSELYLRATAFSTFCPVMQYHSDVNNQRTPSRDRTPWNIQEQTGDRDVIDLFRYFANLRMNLMPYILGQAWECSQTGLPLMRPLFLDFPGDVQSREFPYEFLFGDALLVAPVVEEGVSNWPVYLPEGNWRDLWSGEVVQGPVTISMIVARNRIPVFQKQSSLLPLHLGESGELGSPVGNDTIVFSHITLRLFPGGNFETPLIQSGRNVPDWVRVEIMDSGTIEIDLPAIVQRTDLVIFANEPTSIVFGSRPLTRQDVPPSDELELSPCWAFENHQIMIHLPPTQQGGKITIQ